VKEESPSFLPENVAKGLNKNVQPFFRAGRDYKPADIRRVRRERNMCEECGG